MKIILKMEDSATVSDVKQIIRKLQANDFKQRAAIKNIDIEVL